MPENNHERFRLKYCNYCGYEIPGSLIEEFNKDTSMNVFCENCGIDLRKEIEERENSSNVINSEGEIKKEADNDKSKASNVIRNKRQNSGIQSNSSKIIYPQTSKQVKHVMEIINDPDFRPIFKENLSVAIASIIHVVNEKKDNSIDDLVKGLYDSCFSPKKKMNVKFYKMLHKITRDDFERDYYRLKKKLQDNNSYKKGSWIFFMVLFISYVI